MSNQGTVQLTWENEAEEEVTHSFPSKNEVCHRCEGYGTHLNPSIGEHAYTPEEFDQEFDDEGKEEYFRHGGIYDVQCETCKGEKVLPVVDEEHLSPEDKKLFGEYREWKEEQDAFDADYEAECRMERLMGC